MIERKLKIDLTPLWNQPTNKFIVRFIDLNEVMKRTLAQRIKDVAKQNTIRKLTGPTTQIIYETLTEINPIIFGEFAEQITYRPVNGYKVFNVNRVRTLGGYMFHNLCQAIYLITCVKRNLRKKEMCDIAYLTCQDWTMVSNYIDENYRLPDPEENQTRNLIPEEIELADIQRARRVAEDNGANRIPDGVFQLEDETQNIIDQLVDNETLDDEFLREVRTEGIDPGLERNRHAMYAGRRMAMDIDNRERGVRREPAVERIQREIDRIQNRPNNHDIGSFNWNMEERDRANILETLLQERSRIIEDENRSFVQHQEPQERTYRARPDQLRRMGYFEIETEPTPTDYNWEANPDENALIAPNAFAIRATHIFEDEASA
jgi:hypothetical protein